MNNPVCCNVFFRSIATAAMTKNIDGNSNNKIARQFFKKMF